MANLLLPDYKRRALETRQAQLIEEYDAIMAQLNQTLSAADELKLKRQAQAREAEIAEIDAQLEGRAPQPSPAPQPRKRTSGIPTELSLPLKNTLLQCMEFANNQALQAVLAHEMLTPWRYSVAMTNMPKSQVDMVISQLADQYRSDGQNALVTFLQVLAENYNEVTQLHRDLLDLAEQLSAYK
ncbi:MAG: hypothetical protein ACP5J4_11045 [Anaerolineae bacterium]